MAEIHGRCASEFGRVADTLAASLDRDDVGASVAVSAGDELVVDIWGGYTDESRTARWQRDTITNVWSTTKTMTALCALVLADRGELDPAAPVAEYWPEFGTAGKESVLVRHVLSHTAGLPTWDEPMTLEDLYDWPTATARLAAQTLRWSPGTAAGYHGLTQGYLVGEIVRRITGRSLGVFFAEEIAGPLEADFHIGLPAEHDHRVAPIIAPSASAARDDSAPRGPGNPPVPAAAANTAAWRRAEIPAVGGFGNARSVTAVQSVVANGGAWRGVRLLSREGCERAVHEQFRGMDTVLGARMRYGLGYGLGGGESPSARTCFWGGWGGSLVWVDMDTRMTVSYVMNRMLDDDRSLTDDRSFDIVAAAYDGVTA
ncbi:serine hydrolase domain-containing protein [Nocardia xishanensis]|uniref:serine hydrolase domain-containing protein n=1 Tax=Nocardia xishanensis TaxID=238964 RepID=UPI00343B0FBC